MIKVIAYKTKTDKYDITNLVTDVNWSGDINTSARKLELNLQSTGEIGKSGLLGLSMGNLIIFYVDNEEVFRGYLFSKSVDEKGSESLVIYDQLIYLSKNTDSLLIKNKSASDVIISLLKKFNLPIGSIESTGYKIKKKIIQNQSLGEIFSECLQETRAYMKKSYRISTKQGKVYMVSRSKASKATITVNDVISGSKDISIEETRTKVMVTKGSMEDPKRNKDGEISKGYTGYKSVTVEDKSSIQKYGVMQHVEDVDDKTSIDKMKKKAQTLLDQLKRPNETISIEFIGDKNCITGNMIEIRNVTANIIGKYYITSDSHSFSNGTHTMSLQLSNRLE